MLYPGPFYASHVAITDLKNDKLILLEQSDFSTEKSSGDAPIKYAPLVIRDNTWTLEQTGKTSRLNAGPLNLTLAATKPAVVHPPGFSGTEDVGRMYNVSNTRLGLSGEVSGRPVSGFAWMDHQWGDQLSGPDALWAWFGLRLSNGSDLMLYGSKGQGRSCKLSAPSPIYRETLPH